MFRPVFNVSNLKAHDWACLSENPNVVPILEQHMDKVNWYRLSQNPNAIHILEKHLDKVNWYWLSSLPNAIPILEKNIDKIDWYWLVRSANAVHLMVARNIIKLDTEQMRSHCKPFAEELAQHVFHPLRAERIASAFGMDMDEYLDVF